MSFARSLAVFLLSTVFISSSFAAITLFNIGPFFQKDSISGFMVGQGVNLGEQSCHEQCDSAECESLCSDALESQLSDGVGAAVDDLYGRRFYGVSISDALSFSLFGVMAILSAISAALLAFASKKPLVTLGKDTAVSSVSVMAAPVVLSVVLSSVSLPFDLGMSFLSYISEGLSNQMFSGLVLLLIGVLLIFLNCASKRKNKKN
jgi:hypothetical protein